MPIKWNSPLQIRCLLCCAAWSSLVPRPLSPVTYNSIVLGTSYLDMSERWPTGSLFGVVLRKLAGSVVFEAAQTAYLVSRVSIKYIGGLYARTSHEGRFGMGWAEAASTLQRYAGRQPNLGILTLRALFYTRQCKFGVNPSFLGRAGSSKTREVSATLIRR